MWKLSQGQSMPPPSSESARICYPIREIVDFFLSKVSLFFSIDKGMPSCSNSSFLRRSINLAVFSPGSSICDTKLESSFMTMSVEKELLLVSV